MSAPKIPEGSDGQTIRKWFAQAGLDPNNPDDWPKLLLSKRGGAPRKREELVERLCLDASCLQMERFQANMPPLTVTDVCHALEKEEPYRSEGLDWDALRAMLKRKWDTKDPAVAAMVQAIQEDYVTADGRSIQAWLQTGFVDFYEDKDGNVVVDLPWMLRRT
jgi:hypothetical protein